MLPSEIRLDLRQNSSFFEQAESFTERHVRLLYLLQAEGTGLRVAIIVPKRHGKAVERVKTKRLLRSATIAIQKRSPAVFTLPYSIALLVRGRPQTYEVYYRELANLLERLQQRHEKQTI